MSVVYRARQARPARVVAVKVILAGSHAGPDRRARFLAEADAIARLQHPHIVSVYEVGFADGMPFYSMELVEGGSLDDKLRGGPQPAGPAAALVATLARAVQYAHERGVLHRDLKPGNVLLTAGGEPKVADFGLARLDPAGDGPGGAGDALTASGAVLGTPSYMAPEQASGDRRAVGPACDVYALGAILYEALTGRPPFRAATILETLEQVRTQEVVLPSRLQPGLPRDLETVCLKCLARDAARRYGSAAELADDLGRFREGRPVRARRTPAWERLWKWVRRRPGAAASLALAGLAAAALLGVWASFTVRLQEERDRAKANADERDAQRRRAEVNEDRALEGVDRLLAGVADTRLAAVPGLEEVRRQLLTDALAVLEKFLAQEDGASVRARRQAAAAHRRCALVHAALGDWPRQHHHLQEALRLHRGLAADFPEDGARRFDLAQALHNLGVSQGSSPARDRMERAERAIQEALDLRQQLSEEEPGNEEYRAALANSQRVLGRVRRRQGRLGEAEQAYRGALAVQRGQLGRHPGATVYLSALAETCCDLALLQYQRGNLKDAEQYWAQARDSYERLGKDQPGDVKARHRLAATTNYLGVVFLATGRAERAVEAGQRSLELHTELARRYRSIPSYRGDVASAHNNLARVFEHLGRRDEAVKHYEEACAGYRDLGARFFLAKSSTNLGVVLQLSGKYRQAAGPCREGVAIMTALAAAHPNEADLVVELGRAQTTLANQMLATGEPPQAVLGVNGKAVANLQRAQRMAAGHREARDSLGRALVQQASLLTLTGGHNAALMAWEQARQLGHPFPAGLELLRGLSLARLGRWAEAVRVADGVRAALAAEGDRVLAACLYAAAAEAVAGDPGLGEAQRPGREAGCEAGGVAVLGGLALPPADVRKWPPSLYPGTDGRLLRAEADAPRFAVLLARVHARAAASAPTPREAAAQDALALEALRHAADRGFFRAAEGKRRLEGDPDWKRLRPLEGFKALLSGAGRR
jgi:serine/threonine-protein kinase